MSWGGMFNEKGEFSGVDDDENQLTNQEPGDELNAPLSWDNMGSFGGGSKGNKRAFSQHDGNQSFKRHRGGGGRGGFKAPSSWDDLRDGAGGGGDDSSFSGFSELTSWDQISGGGVGSSGGGSFAGSNEDGSGADFSDSWDQLSNRGGGRGGRGNKSGGKFGGNNNNDGWGGGGGENRYGGSGDNFGGGNKGYGGRGGGNRFGRGGGGGGRGGASGGRGGFAGGGARGTRGGAHGGVTGDAMSLIGKFEKYINFLKNDKAPRQNSIQSLESACIATRCGLKTGYEVEETHTTYNRAIYTAKLSINNIFLARGVGPNKKELKHEVFNKAHEILLRSSTHDINNLKDPGKDLIKVIIEKQLKIAAREAQLEGTTTQLLKPIPDVMKQVNKELDTIALICTGLKKLTTFMKGPTQLPENHVAMLEQAMVASKCRLQHIYRTETTVTDGVVIYDGALYLEDIPIARGRNENRRLCKQETYAAAIEALLNKSVNDLIIPVEKELPDQDNMDADDEPGDVEAATQKANPATKVALTLYHATILADQLSGTSFSDRNVVVIEDCVCNQGLTTTCIYKRLSLASEEYATCDFFIDDVHISTGYGKTKMECMIDAYDNAWETLLYTEPKYLLANHRKMAPNETTDPFVLEVIESGASSHIKESNMATLLRRGYKPESTILSNNIASIIANTSIDNLIIVEPLNCYKDRKQRAFCILQNSATLCGLLLQWTYSPTKADDEQGENNKPEVQCVLYLQGNRIAEHTAVGKVKVRNAAAAEILFKLYETQDVLRVCKSNMKKTALEYKSIAAEANRLRAQAGEPKPAPITDILMKRKVDKFVIQVIENKINSFVLSPNQDELVIGPGLNQMEINEVRQYALEKRHAFRITEQLGIPYLVIQPSIDLKTVVEWLKKTGGGGQYGKYRLVPRSECPTTENVEANM